MVPRSQQRRAIFDGRIDYDAIPRRAGQSTGSPGSARTRRTSARPSAAPATPRAGPRAARKRRHRGAAPLRPANTRARPIFGRGATTQPTHVKRGYLPLTNGAGALALFRALRAPRPLSERFEFERCRVRRARGLSRPRTVGPESVLWCLAPPVSDFGGSQRHPSRVNAREPPRRWASVGAPRCAPCGSGRLGRIGARKRPRPMRGSRLSRAR